MRLALFLLKQEPNKVRQFGNAFIRLRDEVNYCSNCFNISDSPICNICSNPSRNKEIVCVVEDIRDVMAIENTGQYKGNYHVLGGIISPMEGIGPYLDELDVLAPSFAIALFFGWLFSIMNAHKRGSDA